jgi:hypothetical protein
MCKEFQSSVQRVMSSAAAEASGFIRRMVHIESGGWGDEAAALRRIARESKLSFWTLNNIRIGRAKSVNADVRDRIRLAFIEHCRSEAARLLHEAETAAAKGNKNDVLEGIADQIRALAAELEAAKGEAKGGKTQ